MFSSSTTITVIYVRSTSNQHGTSNQKTLQENMPTYPECILKIKMKFSQYRINVFDHLLYLSGYKMGLLFL